MRFDSVLAKALLSSAALMGSARADEIDDALGDAPSPAAEAVSSSTTTSKVIHHPTFTPSAIKAPFFEQFTDDWDTRWTPSHAKKANDQTGDEEWSYVGEWAVEEPTTYKGLEGDKGLVVKNAAAHHAISAKFAKKIDTTGKPLVVQYEVKTQNGLECGGAYLKLLRENKALHAEEFSNDTPYVIMFGPDKCGATNKVHFIFKHKNPKTGEYEEKHLTGPPVARVNKVSHLYTLVVQPDNSFYISIDGDRVKNGTLHDDFTPSVNPEKEIDDADDKKPETWVDDAKVPDPEAAKPEDWDEDAPYEVVDDEAEKPKDWLENEPKTIPDPEAQKPEDWDDEEDGDWIAPTIPNPKCDEVSGCGPWERPMKPNPAYKGKWTAPWIDNPLYKGVWAPRKIANPAYFNDEHPANFEPIGAVGFEIWTMQNNILFDNIYIGHSVEDAEKLKKETYDIKIVPEKEGEAAEFPHPQPDKKKPGSPLDIKFTEDPVAYVTEKGQLFLELLQKDPIEAVKFMPEFAGGAAAALVTVLAVLYGLIGVLFGSASAAAPKVKENAKKAADKASAVAADAKEKVVEATGTEKPAATRRSTRTA